MDFTYLYITLHLWTLLWTLLSLPDLPVHLRLTSVDQVKSIPAHGGGITSLSWASASSPVVFATGRDFCCSMLPQIADALAYFP